MIRIAITTVNLIGALAADLIAEVVVRAATRATGGSGIPAARDLRTAR